MTITTILPSEIRHYFDSVLLSRPCPKFCDDSETLWQIYQYIKKKLEKKTLFHSKRVERFKLLEKEFLELYERAKEKEEKYKKETGNSLQGPFDYFTGINRCNEKLFRKIKYLSRRF